MATPQKNLPSNTGQATISDETAALLRATSVLVVDDEPGMCNFLSRALSNLCASVETAGSVEEGEQLRQRQHFDLMIVDIKLPGVSGVDWLQALRDQGVSTDVIFITAYADLEMAIAALRANATDFLLKPFRMEQIITAVTRCLDRRRMIRENVLLKRQVDMLQPMEGIIGRSVAIKRTCQTLKQVAPSRATILIEGETGTGKELVARAIHELSGCSGPFVALNCGSVSQDLIESELFGHTKGAFTGATQAREGLFSYAQDGSLFLDEIGEMPLPMQSKFLRVLEENKVRPVGAERENPVNARVIAATNRKLSDLVKEGRFRQDLFYRLDVVTIHVPSLRERLDDLPLLIDHFINDIAPKLGVEPIPLTHRDVADLQSYHWPGNVRELKNLIERYLLLGKLPRDILRATHDAAVPQKNDRGEGYPLNWSMAEVERRHTLRILENVGGNKSEAARRLGVSRKTLERKVAAWRLEKEDTEAGAS